MIDCIHDAEIEMWKLGIKTTTRHREVAPGQYEVAPLYTNSILATDQNLLTMDILKRVFHPPLSAMSRPPTSTASRPFSTRSPSLASTVPASTTTSPSVPTRYASARSIYW